jgi:hypothetical protein
VNFIVSEGLELFLNFIQTSLQIGKGNMKKRGKIKWRNLRNLGRKNESKGNKRKLLILHELVNVKVKCSLEQRVSRGIVLLFL